MLRTFCLFLSLCGLAVGSSATSLLRLEIEDLARSADMVVLGSVEATRCEVDASTGLIVSVATLHVERWVAGSSPDTTLEVVTFGGRIGQIRQVVEGEATLGVGEEVALFLTRRPDGRSRVDGMFEGKLEVHAGATEPELERASGPAVIDSATHAYVAPETLRLGLGSFEARVLAARGAR